MFIYNSPRITGCRVVVAETMEEMEQAAQELIRTDERVFGLDTEMVDARVSASYMRVAPNGARFGPTVLIQLASTRLVVLFHFYACLSMPMGVFWTLPETLKKILRSDKFVKVGTATHNDTEGLYRTFGLQSVAQLMDIRAMGTSFGLPFNSLRDVAAWCGRDDIDKQTPHDWCRSLHHINVRCDSIEYAALDAVICLQAHKLVSRAFESLKSPTLTGGDMVEEMSTRCKVTTVQA
jgi:hypothetical protein